MNSLLIIGIIIFYGLSASLVDVVIGKGVKPLTVVLISTTSSAVIVWLIWLSGYAQESQEKLSDVPKNSWIILLLLGPLLFLGDLSYGKALAAEIPTVYVFAALAAVAVAILIFSSIFKGAWPHPMQIAGLIIICVGGFLIRYYGSR